MTGRAVICSTGAWRSSSRVGTHHLGAYLLGRGWSVDWFSAPIGPPHLAALHRRDVRAKARTWLAPIAEGSLTARTPFSLVATGGALRRWTRRRISTWPRWTVPPMARRLRELRGADLLVVDSPLYGFAPSALRAAVTVYRVTDYTPGFPGMTEALLDGERRGIAAADLVMVPSPELAEYASSSGARQVVTIPNGVDTQRFERASPSPRLAHLPGPIAVYVGSLRAWFDQDLVAALARARADLSVVVIGPAEELAERGNGPANLHHLGPVPYDEVPAILAASDIGLIPFDVERHGELVNRVDPIKLYEYCAAGLPVVATWWQALEDRHSPALLAGTHQEFIEQVDRALQRSDELAAAGRRFASTADWEQRFDELLAVANVHVVPDPRKASRG